MILKFTFQTFLFLLISVATIAQNCKENEKFWFWPDDAGYCRVFGEASPGKKPVLFISDVGMEYSYLKKTSKLNKSLFYTVFFDQPGVTHSVCHDSSAKRLSKVTGYISRIQNSIVKMDSINLVCHAQGCHFALAYAQKYPNRVKSLHMVQPPIVKQSGKFYLRKNSKFKPYMKNLNKAYGAMFFCESHQQLIQSFPNYQKISFKDIFLYLAPVKADKIKEEGFQDVYKFKINHKSLDFLNNTGFWNSINKNITH